MSHSLKESIKSICPAFIWNMLRKIHYYRPKFYIDYSNRKWVKSLMGGGAIETIEIETVNRCNGTCPFCPVNVNQPQRKYAKMTDELFKKIINELADMNYSAAIAFYSNNEPFLDERIIDFCKYASEKLPNAYLRLFTNGTLLTFEKFLAIMPYLDVLVIDNYNDDKQINTPELHKVYDYIQEHPEIKERVNFSFRLQNEVLKSRGGQAPNKIGKNDTKMLRFLCTRPFHQFIIRPTGEISLCCNDALGKYTMGDLNTQTISEVWNSEKYKSVREEMLKNGRKNLILCNQCDSFYYHCPEFSQNTKRLRP